MQPSYRFGLESEPGWIKVRQDKTLAEVADYVAEVHGVGESLQEPLLIFMDGSQMEVTLHGQCFLLAILCTNMTQLRRSRQSEVQ